MSNTLKAAIVYFLLVFAAGFVLGTFRTLILVPIVGDLLAVTIELPVMLIISWFACSWAMPRFAVPNLASDRLTMGISAFLLLMAAEVLVSTTLAGRDLAEHFALSTSLPVIVGLFGQIMFALFPLLQSLVQIRSHQRSCRPLSETTGMSGKAAWRWIGLSIVGLAILSVGTVYIAYRIDMNRISERLSNESQVVQTPYGPVEFASWGSGPAVLVVHGAGGGYDQGKLLAEAVGGEARHWISPSRFGYLRTPLPEDASTAAQADAFAALLDNLGIERIAILAMSGGVPPSLQFALRYPERTSALVLLSSAPYTPLTAEEQQLPVPIWIYQALFSSDFPYWFLEKVARPSLEGIFDVKRDLRATLAAEEQVFVTEMVDGFEPVTKRVDGVRNEGVAIDPQAYYPLEEVTTPTLVIHSQDDSINPFAFGEHTAQGIPRAEFMPLETGGHLLLGHHAEVQARVNAFLLKYTHEPNP
jgi:pimeloyl-ACP methyl ester carboxylesterase